MKTSVINIIFFALIFPAFSIAQNWQPIHLDWKYNYKTDSSAIITNTIWIDSSEVVNGDSVFYLNRIVTHCDTCHATLGGPNPCDSCYALSNQSQFLQRKVTKFSNGVFYFHDTSKLIVNSLAALNDTWLFDSVANINAQVISVTTDSVFGTIDSVKTILLTNGDTLKLSMNYGILKFPHLYFLNTYFHLVGIEGLNVGEKVPGFWEIFDFNVGDVFEYHKCGVDPSAPIFYSAIRKYSILSKTISGDTINYGITGLLFGNSQNIFNGQYSSIFYPLNQTLQYIHSEQSISKLYNNQLFEMSNFLGSQSDKPYNYSRVYLDTNGIFTKAYGAIGSSATILCYIAQGPISGYDNFAYSIKLDSTSDVLNKIYQGFDTYSQIYSVGLGEVYFSYSWWEGFETTALSAYKKGNDTVGVFTPDSVFTMGLNDYRLSEIKIYPNPAKEKINVRLGSLSNGKVFITDNIGRKISEKDFSGTEIELDVSTISSGLYFLSVITEKGLFTKKIIVSGE